MKNLFLIIGIFFSANSFAGHCYEAYKESKILESMVSGVLFISEGDSTWTAFASWSPVKEISESEIKRVLGLKDSIDGESTLFSMSENPDELYDFLQDEIDYRLENAEDYGDSEAAVDADKLAQLKAYIKKQYGQKVKLILHGIGEGSFDFFGGDHMITIIMENGCVFGIKAMTAWT